MTTRGASRSLPYMKKSRGEFYESRPQQRYHRQQIPAGDKKFTLVDAGPFFTRRHRQLHHT